MTTLTDRNRDSLINIFVQDTTPSDNRKPTNQSHSSSDDNQTIESYSMSILNSTTDLSLKEEEDINEWFSKMSNEEYLETIFGPALNIKNLSFIEKGKKVLHSGYFHAAVVVLILLDSVFVAVELLLNAENCKNENETLNLVSEVFKFLGLAILSLFMIELVFKCLFLNKELLKSKLEIFDAVVVLISFILELVFLNNKELETVGQIMALFRLWRIVRIANG